MESAISPQPGDVPPASRAAAVVLAAGQGTRMPHAHKLTAPLNGEPLVRRAVSAALASQARPVIVVTGHEGEKVRAALAGLDVVFVDNPDFARGLSTSLKAGIAAVPEEVDRVVVLLGDMPKVEPALIDRLAAAIDPAAGRLIAVPVAQGRRGNPVGWARRLFPALMAIEGDVGARALISDEPELVAEVLAEGEGRSSTSTPATNWRRWKSTRSPSVPMSTPAPRWTG